MKIQQNVLNRQTQYSSLQGGRKYTARGCMKFVIVGPKELYMCEFF